MYKPVEPLHEFGYIPAGPHGGVAATEGPGRPLRTVERLDRAAGAIYTWDTCLPSAGNRAARGETKRKLALFLWSQRIKMLYTDPQAEKIRSEALSLKTGELGRPYLTLDGRNGPSISFSYCAGILWACMAGVEMNVGIDAARAGEFQTGYPYSRAIDPEEMAHALATETGDVPEAAALLWSAKEAAVKALGCGFHLLSPRDVTLVPISGESIERRYALHLADSARSRLRKRAEIDMEVIASRRSGFWISVALSRTDFRSLSV